MLYVLGRYDVDSTSGQLNQHVSETVDSAIDVFCMSSELFLYKAKAVFAWPINSVLFINTIFATFYLVFGSC